MAIKPLSETPGYTPVEGSEGAAKPSVTTEETSSPVTSTGEAPETFTQEISAVQKTNDTASRLDPSTESADVTGFGTAISEGLQSIELPTGPAGADGEVPAATTYQSVLPGITGPPRSAGVDIPIEATFMTPRGEYKSVLPSILQNDNKAGYFQAIRAAESAGNDSAKNPTSTASGRYQFIKGTWNDLVARYPDSGLTRDGRFNPEQQEVAIRLFTQENENVLRAKGIPIGGGTLYSAHFLGAGDAVKVWQAPPNAPIDNFVPQSTMKANPFLKGWSVGKFQSWAERKGNPSRG